MEMMQSRRQTELYYLINRTTGEIDKIGITSNSQSRYSQSYLEAENVRYVPQAQFENRLIAMFYEKLELINYFHAHGRLPRLNKTFR